MAADTEAAFKQAVIKAAVKTVLQNIKGGDIQLTEPELLRATENNLNAARESAPQFTPAYTSSMRKKKPCIPRARKQSNVKYYPAARAAAPGATKKPAVPKTKEASAKEAKPKKARLAADRAENGKLAAEDDMNTWLEEDHSGLDSEASYSDTMGADVEEEDDSDLDWSGSHITTDDADIKLEEEDLDLDLDASNLVATDTDPKAAEGRRTRRTRSDHELRGPALYKAEVTQTADNDVRIVASTEDTAGSTQQLIQECFRLGLDINTPDTEARSALLTASRLMKKYNVAQAEVLAHTNSEEQLQLGGQSVVSIRRNDGDLTIDVMRYEYIDSLQIAMNALFDLRSLTYRVVINSEPRTKGIDITFCGVASNTIAAATAFKMSHNLIVEWVRRWNNTNERVDYCNRICNNIREAAEQEQQDEMERVEKAEATALASKTPEGQAKRRAAKDHSENPVFAGPPNPTIDDVDEDETDEMYLASSSTPSASQARDHGASKPAGTKMRNVATVSPLSRKADDDGLHMNDVHRRPTGANPDRNSSLGKGHEKHTASKSQHRPYFHDQDDEEIVVKQEVDGLENGRGHTTEASSISKSQLISWRKLAAKIAANELQKMTVKPGADQTRKRKRASQGARDDSKTDGKKAHTRVKTPKPTKVKCRSN
ncbi:hypothetical protein CBER1_10970 [Cercospora berteroae]|uniref:DUF7168 domain-containing protein n=1 Tax=Cercospora berteroae TaxID=357750 RepID=A0A2S6CMC2_9PEZI|nr:hypothetical protein CBER1_10970 [Cercospora berteroae]